MSTTGRAGPVRRPRGDLSRERIVEAAVAFVAEHGAERLSMRRLAAELSAGTMTLYGYFRDKDELLDAVVDAIAASYPGPSLRGSWRKRLRDLFLWFHGYLNANPALVRVRLERPIVTAAALRYTELALSILDEAGFSEEEAIRGFRALFVHSFGFAALNPPDQVAEGERQVRIAVAGLPPERYPHVTAHGEGLALVMKPEDQFRYDLELMLDALEARLRR